MTMSMKLMTRTMMHRSLILTKLGRKRVPLAVYALCWPCCFCIVPLGLSLAVSTIQINTLLHHSTFVFAGILQCGSQPQRTAGASCPGLWGQAAVFLGHCCCKLLILCFILWKLRIDHCFWSSASSVENCMLTIACDLDLIEGWHICEKSLEMCICLWPEFDCSEVTLYGWQDIKIQLLLLLLLLHTL